ncbi:MAG: pyrroline-5-carboxylate reductase [Candidatus Omnitrophica bacterium]|jgi:pyrroline-5-carboxylate reductase|nr:pyrroline-5-carboxylate reductase [Candidatus Omnitrophota bacterium]
MKIGIIGLGNMGQAIASKIKNTYTVFAYEKDKARVSSVEDIQAVGSIQELLEKADAIILAVKPQDFAELLGQIKKYPHILDKLFISIAAGLGTSYIENLLGVVRVVRVMPNMPARIGYGMTCLCSGKYASLEDFDFAQDVFEYMGEVMAIDEAKMDEATAISGSGPGWFFNAVANNPEAYKNNWSGFMENFTAELEDAARSLGFSPDQAHFMSLITLRGADKMLENGADPVGLRQQVASKGGTTQAGLDVLNSGGTLKDAIMASIKRAKELAA